VIIVNNQGRSGRAGRLVWCRLSDGGWQIGMLNCIKHADPERCAFASFRPDRHTPPGELCQPLHNGQSQSNTVASVRQVAASLKRFEQAGLFVSMNAGAPVANQQGDLTVGGFRGHQNVCSFAVADGIGDEILQDAPDDQWVAFDHRIVRLRAERTSGRIGRWSEFRDDVVDQVAQTERMKARHDPPGIQQGNVEKRGE